MKELQEYIDEMEAKGITPTMEDLKLKIEELYLLENDKPRVDFEGYSSIEMRHILYSTFQKESPIQLKTLQPKEYSQIPIFRQIKRLTEILAEGDIKLTPAGYLPIKIVHELYPLGALDDLIECGLFKLGKEMDCIPVHLARILSEVSRITKRRKNVLSLTAIGKKMMLSDDKLFELIFEVFCQKYNWHYFDDYSDTAQSGIIGQVGFGFSLILLSKYGHIERSDLYYADKYFKAFPMLLDTVQPTYGTAEDYGFNCYSLRTFERFLYFFGLIEIEKERHLLSRETYIRKTPLFDKLISLSPPKEFKKR